MTIQNPLETEKISKLLFKFAVPSIIGMLVSALYNIVDQIFIGRDVGVLGNAATNVAFPIATICIALALLFGVGASSVFNLKLGAKQDEEAGNIIGNAITLMLISGVIFFIIVRIFLSPLLVFFGASAEVMPYALEYAGITSFGIPFLILSTGASSLIRADGSPVYSMNSMFIGAVLNTILDPLFMFVFHMGIKGAAIATVLSQIISCIIVLSYFRKFKSVKLIKQYFYIKKPLFKAIVSLGAAVCFNHLAMTVVQITMNNVLKYYGDLSVYGSDIPLAAVGIITKVNIIFMAFIIGTSQGSQPIIGYNYGAKNYMRVKDTYYLVAIITTIVSTIAFLCFQFIPRQIISIFGSGDEIYYQFAIRYFRIFMMLAFINGIQPATSTFFTSIGKARKGVFLSLIRQVLILLPLIIILPIFLGIDGVMYAGPVADGIAGITAFIFVTNEMRLLNTMQVAKTPVTE